MMLKKQQSKEIPMKKTPAYCLVLLSFCVVLGSCSNPAGGSGADPASSVFAPLYVAEAAAGTGDGSSWANAMDDVQEAIDAAAKPGSGKTHVLIQAGTFYPEGYPNEELDSLIVTTDDQYKHFSLRNGVTVIGGFLGDEEDDNPLGGTTTLSGGPVTNGIPGTSNVFHVFYHPTGTNLDNTAVLNNVTITGGNSTGNTLYYGGGMYNAGSSPAIINCTFSGNSSSGGSGMYNDGCSPVIENCTFLGNSSTTGMGGGLRNSNDSNPIITNCTFSGNTASYGGGMYNSYNSNPTITNCTFSGNKTGPGGGMCNVESSPIIENCTFVGNSAGGGQGGGINNTSYSNSIITNCTFSGNSAVSGGGMHNSGNSNPTITNCTFSGNSAVSGGGMYNSTSSPKVFGSIFAGNHKSNGSSVSEIEGSSIDPASKDNLIRGSNYSGTLIALFDATEGSGNTEHGVPGDTAGPTGTKTIKIKEIDAARITLPVNWSYTGDSGVVAVPMPNGDQRGYTRSKTGNIGYMGAADPRVP